jgi:hypothetical protein
VFIDNGSYELENVNGSYELENVDGSPYPNCINRDKLKFFWICDSED